MGVVAGIITAGGIHATKAAARPVVNVSTAGVGGPVVSLIEDAVSLAASLLAVLAPLLLIVFVAGLVWWLRRMWVRRRESRALRGGAAEIGPGSVSPGP